MHIGIDVDDVLTEYYHHLMEYCNQKFNTNVTYADIFSYDLYKVWECSPEEALDRVKEFYTTQAFLNLQPIFEAISQLDILSKEHQLTVITARPDTLKGTTLEWLERHYPKKITNVHFTNRYINATHHRKKSDVGKEIGIDVMIDDSLEHAMHCAEEGISVLLYDRPWNRDVILPSGVTRVHTWEEIVLHIGRTNISIQY